MSAPVIAGVPLAQFAAVTAALVEGFPLRAVLSIEGIDAARWTEADRGWTERLDSDAALLEQYQSDLTAAQSRLLSREDPPPEGGAAKGPVLRVGKARLVRLGAGDPRAAVEAPRFLQAPAPVLVATVSAPYPEPRRPPDDDDESTRVGYQIPASVLPFQAPPDDEVDEYDELASTAPARPGIHHGADVLPFRAPQPASAPPPPPPPPVMSLERHASLCLEIAVDPARAAEALARYQVSAADKALADEHYRARFAVDPELCAQWNHVYTAYHAWFTSRPWP